VNYMSVVPAHAGTHIPEAVVMGPRFRGDDSKQAVRLTCISQHRDFTAVEIDGRPMQPRPP
jgi:hypothetical protein